MKKSIVSLRKFGPFTYERVGSVMMIYGLGLIFSKLGRRFAFSKIGVGEG